MYGNYSHFMKFPTGFGGKCFSVCTVRGDGRRWGNTGYCGITCVYMHVRCASVRARVCTRGCIRRGQTAAGEDRLAHQNERAAERVWDVLRSERV